MTQDGCAGNLSQRVPRQEAYDYSDEQPASTKNCDVDQGPFASPRLARTVQGPIRLPKSWPGEVLDVPKDVPCEHDRQNQEAGKNGNGNDRFNFF